MGRNQYGGLRTLEDHDFNKHNNSYTPFFKTFLIFNIFVSESSILINNLFFNVSLIMCHSRHQVPLLGMESQRKDNRMQLKKRGKIAVCISFEKIKVVKL